MSSIINVQDLGVPLVNDPQIIRDTFELKNGKIFYKVRPLNHLVNEHGSNIQKGQFAGKPSYKHIGVSQGSGEYKYTLNGKILSIGHRELIAILQGTDKGVNFYTTIRKVEEGTQYISSHLKPNGKTEYIVNLPKRLNLKPYYFNSLEQAVYFRDQVLSGCDPLELKPKKEVTYIGIRHKGHYIVYVVLLPKHLNVSPKTFRERHQAEQYRDEQMNLLNMQLPNERNISCTTHK